MTARKYVSSATKANMILKKQELTLSFTETKNIQCGNM